MPHAISQEARRPLDFHDLTSLNEERRQRAIEALDPILCAAFVTLDPNWSCSIRQPNKTVTEALLDWRLSVLDPLVGRNPRSDYYFDFTLFMSEVMYPTLSLENRINASELTGIIAILDDQMPKDTKLQQDAECFLRNIRSGRSSQSPVLQKFSEYISRSADAKSDPLTSDYLWHSWLNFIVGTNFEDKPEALLSAMQLPLQGHNNKRPTFSASDLPYFIRLKSGCSEAVTVELLAQNEDHPIPVDMWFPVMSDVVVFTNLSNDLLSAPKELLKGDHATYLNYQTQVKRQVGTPGSGADGLWCFEDTVLETTELCIQSMNRIDAMVTGRYEQEKAKDISSQSTTDAKFVRDSWMIYKAGYLELHFDYKRYNAAKFLPGLERLRLKSRQSMKP